MLNKFYSLFKAKRKPHLFPRNPNILIFNCILWFTHFTNIFENLLSAYLIYVSLSCQTRPKILESHICTELHLDPIIALLTSKKILLRSYPSFLLGKLDHSSLLLKTASEFLFQLCCFILFLSAFPAKQNGSLFWLGKEYHKNLENMEKKEKFLCLLYNVHCYNVTQLL